MLSDILPVIQQITDAANEQPGNGLPGAADGQRYAIGVAVAGGDFTPWGTVVGSLGQTLTALAPGEIIEFGSGRWVRQLALGAQHVDVSVPQIGGAQLRWSGTAFTEVVTDPEAALVQRDVEEPDVTLTGPMALPSTRRFYRVQATAPGQTLSVTGNKHIMVRNIGTINIELAGGGRIRRGQSRTLQPVTGGVELWDLG